MSQVLVTGANGFVGRRLLARLQGDGVRALGAVRKRAAGTGFVQIPDLGSEGDYRNALHGCDAVVHIAARVHVMQDKEANPLEAFREINTRGTLALARQAEELGVRRFVFISSIKVNGESSPSGRRISADDVPAPADAYAISKSEAESGLMEIASSSGMEVTIIRPPLVYGPGVKGNFLRMMKWLSKGLPLPLGAIHDNRRTLVALDNLVDLIATCLVHPAAANQIFLAGDSEDLSTTDLLRRLAAAMDVPARLIPVPVGVLELLAAATGRRAMVQRLCGNLQLDISKNRMLLGWMPPVSVDEGLRRTAGEMLRGFASPM